MKIGQIFKKMVGGSMILAALACPMFTSCYDDEGLKQDLDEIKESLESLEDRVAALETRLETEVSALQKMIGGLVTVKSAEKDGANWNIELSDGTKFTVYPETVIPDAPTYHEGTVTITEVDGVKVWAVYNADGEAVPVTDAAGNNVPVVPEAEEVEVVAPQVRFNDETKAYEISFDGGQTWTVTGYEPSTGETEGCTCESIFEDVELVYDEGQYDYTSVIFTLVDGYTFSVTLSSEWSTFAFFSHYAGAIDRCYFAPGSKRNEVPVRCLGYTIEDWMVDLPQGWKFEFEYDDMMQLWQAYVTAPSAADIESGKAAAAGDLKLLGVMKGGSTKVASMYVTTSAFKTVKYDAKTNICTVALETGYEGMYMFGIVPASGFSAESVAEKCQNDILSGMGMPYYYDMEVDSDELYMQEIEAGVPMVLWAVPVVQGEWNDDLWSYEYEVSADALVAVEFSKVKLSIEATSVSAVDIQIRAELKGVDKFYAGLQTVQDFADFESYDLPYTKYWDVYENDGQVYTGSILNFPTALEASVEPGNDYIYWLIIYDETKQTYTMDDVYTFEFSSEMPIPGGTAEPVFSNAKIDYSSIRVTLGCDAADWSIIYCAYMEEAELLRYPDDEMKAEYLLENGTMFTPDSWFTNLTASPLGQGETRVLVAMVLDSNGMYGPVKTEKYTTLKAKYNEDIKVSITLDPEFPSNKGGAKLTATGGTPVSYWYWYGPTNEYMWTSSMGGTEEKVESYASTNTYAQYYFKTAAAADGVAEIEMTNLSIGVEYALVVLAKDADGVYSRASFKYFTPAFDLGTIVYADEAAYGNYKPTVEFISAEDFEFYEYKFSVTAPAGCAAAYVVAEHPDYNPDKKVATRDLINYIIATADVEETAYHYVENEDGGYDTIEVYYPHGNYTRGYGVVFEGETVTFTQPYGNSTDLVYITWKDAAGNFHEPLQLSLQY